VTDDLIARLREHFADCPERGGEKSSTRPLLNEAADALEALREHANAMSSLLEGWNFQTKGQHPSCSGAAPCIKCRSANALTAYRNHLRAQEGSAGGEA
jgi:hypothetical protein